ncbi:MAG: leucyl aminopeptidase [Candidatus Nanopelagicales bacterium]|jgi:leucyl aminopeptidase
MPTAKKSAPTSRAKSTLAASVPRFTLTATKPKDLVADALIVNTAPGKGDSVELVAHGFTPTQARRIATEIAHLGGSGATGEVITLASGSGVKSPILIAVGLGDFRNGFDLEQFRRAMGNGVRALSGAKKVAISGGHSPEHVDATVIACALAAYTFNEYKTKPSPASVGSFVISIPTELNSSMKSALAQAQKVAASIYVARNLINTPPNDLAPADLASAAKTAVSSLPVTVKIWDEKALKASGCGAILGVGLGSSRPPRLIKMTYAPKGAKAHLSLIGKGITFDTGGISIKPASKMDEMKADMSGSAAVIAAVSAIAGLGLNLKVTGWVAAAENMPSGTAQRPGDIVTTFDGTTVEVLNTDAEGRLVLADAIGMSVREKPDLMVDIATLTGAQRIALGRRIAGVMSNTESARDQVVAASGMVGEEMWGMPLPTYLRETLKSQTADIANIGDGLAGMLSAGVFLQEFVPDSQPWVHIDVAGPAYNDVAPYGYTPKGGTGAGVRTLVQIARELSAG